MSKLVIDKTGLQGTIITSINGSLAHISTVKNIIGYTTVPFDFKYRQRYFDYTNNITKIYNNLSNVRDWLTKSIKNSDSLDSNLTTVASLLPNNRVAVRQTVIK